MKKLLFAVCLIISSSALFAQRSNVSKADRLTTQDNPDFKAAREAIEPAFTNESTKDDPKTYYVAAMIGHDQNEALVKEMFLQKQVDPMVKGNAIMESYRYFIKSYELDQRPNKKGKIRPKYTKKIKRHVKEFYEQQYNLIAFGAHLFDNNKYKEALDVFEVFLEIPNQPFMEGELSTTDSTYRMIKYFTAIAASKSDNKERAIELYTDLLDDDYETKNVYQLLAEEYRVKTDTVNQLKTLEAGFKKYNDDPWFLQNIINIYINQGEIQKAADYLDTAIEQSPEIAEYHYVKGNIEERLGNTDKARQAFDKALELNPNMADAYSGIGRLIYNKAVEILKEADNIKDNKLYNEEVEKANKIFREAQPFMEKACEMNPEDRYFKQALKTLYYRIGENEKYDAISKELQE